jgi:hypothetical protein
MNTTEMDRRLAEELDAIDRRRRDRTGLVMLFTLGALVLAGFAWFFYDVIRTGKMTPFL